MKFPSGNKMKTLRFESEPPIWYSLVINLLNLSSSVHLLGRRYLSVASTSGMSFMFRAQLGRASWYWQFLSKTTHRWIFFWLLSNCMKNDRSDSFHFGHKPYEIPIHILLVNSFKPREKEKNGNTTLSIMRVVRQVLRLVAFLHVLIKGKYITELTACRPHIDTKLGH